MHTWGSGELLRSLLADGLLDRLNLWMYPIALGKGKRLFEAGWTAVAFRPAQPTQVFESGVMALVFEPAGDVETGDVAAASARWSDVPVGEKLRIAVRPTVSASSGHTPGLDVHSRSGQSWRRTGMR